MWQCYLYISYMKSRPQNIIILISLLLLLGYSCSSTKYVPDNEFLLDVATVKVDAKDVSYFDLEPYVKQKANFKTFEIFKLPLFMYNLSGKDSTKWYNRALKRGGEPPVLYDSTQVEPTVVTLERVMNNKGYLHAQVEPKVIEKDKRAKVIYDVKSGTASNIESYKINISDTVFDANIIDKSFPLRRRRANTSDSTRISLDQYLSRGNLLKEGDRFDLDLLDEERDRITSILRRNGYMAFNKEYIGFVADTIDKKNKVDLELIIYPFTQRIGNNDVTEIPHRQYYVDKIDIYVDYDPITDGDINHYQATDTVTRGYYSIFYGTRGRYIKPFVILENCYIQPQSLYNENQVSATYNALAQLHILKNINIKYEEYLEGDSTKLKCIITAVPDKRQGISAEVEGTNSAGFFGVGASLGYVHRNAFKGSELFNAKLRGSYEAVTPNFSSFRDNYFEIGGETSLTFPRFLFPFLSHDLRRRLRASTQVVSSYTYQRRPNYFTRTVFSTGVKYIWENRTNNTVRHTLDLIEISYAHIPRLDPRFESTLSPNAKLYSFTDQFIVSTGYTYYKTNAIAPGLIGSNRKNNRSTYSLRASVETAGNALALAAALAKIERDPETGSRKIFDTFFAQYVRGNIDYSKSIRIDDKNALAWRLGGGIAYAYGNNKQVPFEKRFFSGGANSVRGWAARELGPGAFYRADANFNDQSGDLRFDANIEYRSKVFWKLELATFVDAGNIWTIRGSERQDKGEFKFDSFYKQIAYAWGLGIRLDLEFVIIRLDCGWKVYNPADIPVYRTDESGYQVVDGYQSKWSILKPFRFRENTAWHIAVGYPF